MIKNIVYFLEALFSIALFMISDKIFIGNII